MERNDVTILRRNNGTFVAIEADKIVSGFLRDTYDMFGEKRTGDEKAVYCNYFNGSDWCSLIIQCEALDCDGFSFVDDDLADRIFTDFDSAREKEEINGTVYFEGKDFNHTMTKALSCPFWFESKRR